MDTTHTQIQLLRTQWAIKKSQLLKLKIFDTHPEINHIKWLRIWNDAKQNKKNHIKKP